MILLYADDPGGANFLSPVADALLAHGMPHSFFVASSLAEFMAERGMTCRVRSQTVTAENMLDNVRLLMVGTSEDRDCFAHSLVDTARTRGIVSLGVVDMAVNADRRFRGRSHNPLRYAPDWLAVTDSATAMAYIALGYPVDRLLICGHPHYDKVRARRDIFLSQDRNEQRQICYPQASAGRPIWLFLAEGIDQLDPAVSFRSPDYTLHGRGGHDFRSVIVLEEVLDAAAELDPRPWVVLRLHPKNRIEEFAFLAPELGMISQAGDPLPLVWSADLVLGMTTMLLLETYLLGRPHFAILPRAAERAWLYTLNEGLTQSVYTRRALRDRLALPYMPPYPSADTLPKNAVSRLLEHILHLI
ncbi:MAG: hypothetical protein ACNA7G_05325 [Methylobacter sp.]